MLTQIEKQQILFLKTYQFTAHFKDDVRRLADQKQQISQKMIFVFTFFISIQCEHIHSYFGIIIITMGDILDQCADV